MWGFVIALYALLVVFIVGSRTRVLEPHALALDFGNSPDLVELTLRAVAQRVEREGICNLIIYLESQDEECKRIAMRLSQYIPIGLHFGPHPSLAALQVTSLSLIHI